MCVHGRPERGDISQPTTMDSEQITKNPPFPPCSPIPQLKIVGVVVVVCQDSFEELVKMM